MREALGVAEEMQKPGFEALTVVPSPDIDQRLAYDEYGHNQIYEQYMRMHKVLVGKGGARRLENVYEHLKDEAMPRYLVAAGSAAVEAALVQADKPVDERLQLFESGIHAWQRAIINQRHVNSLRQGEVVEHALPYRVALDIATSELLQEVIRGRVTMATTRSVFEDCINIAQANIVQIALADKEGNIDAIGEHTGLGYECNALLSFNRRHARKRFMVPSLARADSGYYHRQQTHDLMIINQEWGEIRNVIPVEIKASTARRDHQRYGALIVRGKMHLSNEGRCRPGDTLEAIVRDYNHRAGSRYDETADSISERIHEMVQDYCAGASLGSVAVRSVTSFHENKIVAMRHPGFQTAA